METTVKSVKSDVMIVETSNYSTIFKMCQDAQKRHKMLGLIGYTGAGKTTALKEYQRTNKNVYYISCKNIMNRKQFFQELISAMDICFMGNVYEMVNLICDEFNRKNKPLLIIDESGKLSHTLYMDLHDLRDNTDSNLGIILSGCEYFKENFEKAVRKQKQGMPELYSRIMNWQTLNVPTKAEIKAICQAYYIEDQDTINSLLHIKNFRTLYNTIMSYLFSAQNQE